MLELLVTMAIIAILSAFAIPSFRSFMLNSRRTEAVNDLVGMLQLARSEAAKQGRVVTVCASNDLLTCSAISGDWNTGWIVFVDLNNDGDADPGENVLAAQRPDAAAPTITAGRFTLPNTSTAPADLTPTQFFIFRPFQRVSTGGMLTLCDSRGDAAARGILIEASGRAYSTDRNSDGTAITC